MEGSLDTDYVSWTVLRVTWPPIQSNSIVLISASEFIPDDVPRFTPVFKHHVGSAPITVRNIAPQDGFVEFWIYVDWESDLPLAVDIVVLDPPELMVVVDSDLQNQEVFQVDVRPQHMARKFLEDHLSEAQLKEYQRLLLKESGTLGHVTTSVKSPAKRSHPKSNH